jgi:fructokinase
VAADANSGYQPVFNDRLVLTAGTLAAKVPFMNKADDHGPVIFGEVLFDCFPDGASVLGGAPFNVAWHLQAFGLSPLMISRVGDDALGAKVREAMRNWQMDTRGLQTDPAHPTGSVEVEIVSDEPRYTILDQRAYDHIDPKRLPSVEAAQLLYHGTLALRNARSRGALEYLRGTLETTILLDVNLRDPWWKREEVLALADASDWVKLNEDELALLGETGTADVHARARRFLQRHALSGLVVTLGSRGAVAYTAAGETTTVEPAAVQDIVDTVGAGDAFTSVLILGLIRHWPLAATLRRAQEFASRVVVQRGATIHDPAVYRGLVKSWGTL